MEKVFVIIKSNAYDGFERPYNDVFFKSEAEAQKECDKINKFHCGANKKYWSYDVYDLDLSS